MKFLAVEVVTLIHTNGEQEYAVVSTESPLDDIKEIIKADRLAMMHDTATGLYYLFDKDGVMMCRQMNAGFDQKSIEGELITGPVVEIARELIEDWI